MPATFIPQSTSSSLGTTQASSVHPFEDKFPSLFGTVIRKILLRCLAFLLLVWALTPFQSFAVEGKLIASYYDSWNPEPVLGWKVMTNSRGPIGVASNYDLLTYVKESPKRWTNGENYYTNEAKTLRTGSINNRIPGSRDGVMQYAISSYQFSEDYSEDVWVTQGNMDAREKGEGIDLKIYLNDTLKFDKVVPIDRKTSLFQCNLGPVKKGETVYVAFASKDAYSPVVRLLYTIEAFPQGAVSPQMSQIIKPNIDEPSPVFSFQTLKPSEEYLKKHQDLCAALLQQKPSLVFIGDSITARLGTPEMLATRFGKAYNAGMFAIGGDTVQNVLWRVENGPLEQVKPKAIVLLIGTNNVSQYSAEEIFSGIEKIVQTVHRQTPDTQIVLMGVFPRGEWNPVDPRTINVKQLNTKLAEFAKKNDKLHFLDIGDRLVAPDGSISREIMPDKLHVAPKGLDIWAEAIAPVLARIFNDK